MQYLVSGSVVGDNNRKKKKMGVGVIKKDGRSVKTWVM